MRAYGESAKEKDGKTREHHRSKHSQYTRIHSMCMIFRRRRPVCVCVYAMATIAQRPSLPLIYRTDQTTIFLWNETRTKRRHYQTEAETSHTFFDIKNSNVVASIYLPSPCTVHVSFYRACMWVSETSCKADGFWINVCMCARAWERFISFSINSDKFIWRRPTFRQPRAYIINV